MKRQTFMRRAKRNAMREQKATFTDRVRTAIQTHKPVQDVRFNASEPQQKFDSVVKA